jgi:hypothetical protein
MRRHDGLNLVCSDNGRDNRQREIISGSDLE